MCCQAGRLLSSKQEGKGDRMYIAVMMWWWWTVRVLQTSIQWVNQITLSVMQGAVRRQKGIAKASADATRSAEPIYRTVCSLTAQNSLGKGDNMSLLSLMHFGVTKSDRCNTSLVLSSLLWWIPHRSDSESWLYGREYGISDNNGHYVIVYALKVLRLYISI